MAAMTATTTGPTPGQRDATRSSSGTALPPAVPEHADRHELQREVGDADDRDRDRGGQRDGAARVLELARDVGHRLPPGEGPDEQADRRADAGQAVRQERLEVRAARVAGAAHATTTPTTTTTSAPERASCTQPATRSPKRFETNGGTKMQRDDGDDDRSSPEAADDVRGAQHGDDGGAEADAEEEPVAGHAGRGLAQGEPDEGGDAAGIRIPRGERGKGAGQRDGEQQHGGDGEHRGRAGRVAARPGSTRMPVPSTEAMYRAEPCSSPTVPGSCPGPRTAVSVVRSCDMAPSWQWQKVCRSRKNSRFDGHSSCHSPPAADDRSGIH